MPKLYANGIDIHYEITGDGDPMVLIAGLGYSSWMWRKMIPGLAKHFRVIAFDNRGVGDTTKPAGPYTAQMLADDTAGLLQQLDIDRAIVLGHSMGGFIAQALALSHPNLVDKLILSATNFGGPHHIPITPEAMAVLTDVTGDPVARLTRGILISCAPGFGDAHPEIVDEWIAFRLQNPLQPAPYQAQMAIGLGLLSEENCFEQKLKNIQAPTLILFGEHDKVVPTGNAELLAQQIPNSRIAILPNVGHFYPLEDPDAANAAIIGFVKG
ncbi:MAG: alpha/beta fold hydrolase [Chloroflexi bacterium]|nr:alpha/beta fold hydrolase [Chloroflexota bacterium]